MKKVLPILITSLFFVVAPFVMANRGNIHSNLIDTLSKRDNRIVNFTENKGQILDQDNNLCPNVLFSGTYEGIVFHLKNNGISYQLCKTELEEIEDVHKGNYKSKNNEIKSSETSIHRVDISWINTNSNFTTNVDDSALGFSNFYNTKFQDGILQVKSYSGVTYKNLYTNIDLHFYSQNGHLKYDYIVAPYTDYTQIKFKISGADTIYIQNNGNLIIKTPLGDISEDSPIVMQNNKIIAAKWVLEGTVVSYEIEDYNPKYSLIIDPIVRTWGTYYGGADMDFGQSCTLDILGNVYMSGYSKSISSIATSGSYQTTVSGNYDSFLVKFSSSGVRLWSTYYGGVGDDYAYSCSTDNNGFVYIAGKTKSTAAIATSVSHQASYGGGTFDAFLVKFDGMGVRQWGTYYGGTGEDVGYSCSTDIQGNIFLTGSGYSSNAFITLGAHQVMHGGGIVDAFLVKFNSAGVRQWGTFYGGASFDYSYSCCTDTQGNVFIAGNTYSLNGISSLSSHQEFHGGGGYDSFIAKFNSDGIRQWGTYYGGLIDDFGSSCVTDLNGNVYLSGESHSTNAISTNGSHQSSKSGGFDAFLVKFNSGGSRIWGTYYGGNGHEESYSCSTDPNGNVYLAGWSTSLSGISTANGHQVMMGGTEDAFISKFSENGVRLWATYYGGVEGDFAMSCSNGVLNNFYICGYTQTLNSVPISSSGSHQENHGSGVWDAFLVEFNDCSIQSISSNNNGPICLNQVLNLFVDSLVGTTYSWTGPNGFTSNLQNPTLLASSVEMNGDYTVTVTIGGCPPISSTTNVSVFSELPLQIIPAEAFIFTGDSVSLSVNGAQNFVWSPPLGLSCTNCSNPIANPEYTIQYYVVGTDSNGCIGFANVIVNVSFPCNDIFIPNIFSPNNDGLNDFQCVFGDCIVTMNYTLYDRWGGLIFESNSINECWDGQYKGKKMDSNVFIYKFKASLLDGSSIEKSGSLTLIR